MSINGIGQNYYQNSAASTKSTKSVNSTEKFALEKTDGTQELSEAEEMEIFKKEFYEELSKITIHKTLNNVAEIKGFFMEYCGAMYARDENTILNVYETFLDVNYAESVNACFDKGKTIAAEEGTTTDGMVYYDAEYYYRSEEIHDLLKEAAKEYGEKYGVEVDAAKRDGNFKGDYLTGEPNFNDKWNFMAANIYGVGRIMDMGAVPPEGFSFFYHLGEDMGTKDSLLIVRGKDWTEKSNVPFEIPTAGRKYPNYFYLSDLCQISSEKEENHKQYNDFLNKLVINRVAPGIIIERR